MENGGEKANESEIMGGNVNWNSNLIDNITDDQDPSVNLLVNNFFAYFTNGYFCRHIRNQILSVNLLIK